MKTKSPPGRTSKNFFLRAGTSAKTRLTQYCTCNLADVLRIDQTLDGVNNARDHVDEEHQEDNEGEQAHDGGHGVDVGDELLRDVREVDALEHEPQHQHYVDEVDREHERVVELRCPELSRSQVVEYVSKEPVPECEHRNVDGEQEQGWRHECQHVHQGQVEYLHLKAAITFALLFQALLDGLEGEEATIDPSLPLAQKTMQVFNRVDPGMRIGQVLQLIPVLVDTHAESPIFG